jgi:hypothetical protein
MPGAGRAPGLGIPEQPVKMVSPSIGLRYLAQPNIICLPEDLETFPVPLQVSQEIGLHEQLGCKPVSFQQGSAVVEDFRGTLGRQIALWQQG